MRTRTLGVLLGDVVGSLVTGAIPDLGLFAGDREDGRFAVRFVIATS
jgi:hypothetical protein